MKKYLLLVIISLFFNKIYGTPVFYGTIDLDVSYDATKINDGNIGYEVLRDSSDDEFNMTAKNSIVGIRFENSDSTSLKLLGKVEIDFAGGGAENAPIPRMRHTFIELQSPVVNLLAGQTSDLFAPLIPTTPNNAVMWKCGNVGHRRPQLRFSKGIKINKFGELSTGVSFNRSMADLGEEGEDAGIPTIEYRVGISNKLLGSRPTVLGISGVQGKQESDLLDKEFEISGVAIDLVLPVTSRISLMGEAFKGKNLAVFMGGIGQGIDRVNKKEISAMGWWAQLFISLSPKIEITIASGKDDAALSPNSGNNSKDENITSLGNIFYKINSSMSAGLEYTLMATKYGDGKTFRNNRAHFSLIYRF